MTSFFKRIGKKATKFQVEIFVEKVLINIKFDAELSVVLSRGKHRDESKRVKVNPIGINEFNENLSLITTLYLDPKNGKYMAKKGNIQILLHADKTKVAGNIDLKLSDYANQTIKEKNEVMALGSVCPDKNARIYFKFKMALFSDVENDVIEEVDDEDNPSGEKKRKPTDDSSIDDSQEITDQSIHHHTEPAVEKAIDFSQELQKPVSSDNTLFGREKSAEPVQKTKTTVLETSNPHEVLKKLPIETTKPDSISMMKKPEKTSVSESKATEPQKIEKPRELIEVKEDSKDEIISPSVVKQELFDDKLMDDDDEDDDNDVVYAYNPASQDNAGDDDDDDVDPLDFISNKKQEPPAPKPQAKDGFGRAVTITPSLSSQSRPLFGGDSKAKPSSQGSSVPQSVEKKNAYADLFKPPSQPSSAIKQTPKLQNEQPKPTLVQDSSHISRSQTIASSNRVDSPSNDFKAMKAEALKKRAHESANSIVKSQTSTFHAHQEIGHQTPQKHIIHAETTNIQTVNAEPEKVERPERIERTNSRAKTISQIDNDRLKRIETENLQKENQLHSLKEELANKTMEAKKLARREAELLEQLNILQKDSNSSKQNVNQEIVILRQKLQEKSSENGDLSDKLDNCQRELEELKQSLYSKSEEVRAQNNEIKALRDSIKNLENKLVIQEEENRSIRSNLFPKYENEIQNYKAEIEKLKNFNRKIIQEKDDLAKEQEDIVSTKEETEKYNNKHKDRINFLENQNKALEEKIRAIEEDKTGLYAKANNKFRLMDAEISKFTTENSNLKAELSEILKKSQESGDEYEKKIIELRKQLSESETKREEALTLQTKLMLEITTLKKETTSGASSKSDLSQTDSSNSVKDIYEAEINRLKEKLKASQEEFDKQQKELKANIEHHKAENRELNYNYKELKGYNDVLKQKIEELNETSSATSKKIDTNTDSEVVKKLESKIQQYSKKIEDKDSEINSLRNNLVEIEAQKRKLKSDYDTLLSDRDASRSNMISQSEYEEMLQKTRATEFNLRKQIEEMKREIQILKEKSTEETVEDGDMAKISLENESLKKQIKELNMEKNSMRSNRQAAQNKELEDLRVKNKELEKALARTGDDLAAKKERLAEIEGSSKESDNKFQTQAAKMKRVEETLTIMESELVKTKQKLGEIMSLLMDTGDDDLMEKVYAVMDGGN